MNAETDRPFATQDGTEHFTERFSELHPDHFELCHDLYISSIGHGTYLGDISDEADAAYIESLTKSACSGCNLVDTAINYRLQRSERCVGAAIRKLLELGFRREELVICSKGGYIAFDTTWPDDPGQWIEENLIRKGIVAADDISDEGHCLSPMFLLHQLQKSLGNLGLESLDIYYVHNPETRMGEVNEEQFYLDLEIVFRMLESCVDDGKIQAYGVATWDGFIRSREQGENLSLEKLLAAARRAGGTRHHFQYIQLPFNLGMPEALTLVNQKIGDRMMTIIEAARTMNIGVMASASLLQGQLARHLPETLRHAISHAESDAQRALQFVRSTPGITSALVGMGSPEHVARNLQLASHPFLSPAEFHILFGDR